MTKHHCKHLQQLNSKSWCQCKTMWLKLYNQIKKHNASVICTGADRCLQWTLKGEGDMTYTCLATIYQSSLHWKSEWIITSKGLSVGIGPSDPIFQLLGSKHTSLTSNWDTVTQSLEEFRRNEAVIQNGSYISLSSGQADFGSFKNLVRFEDKDCN